MSTAVSYFPNAGTASETEIRRVFDKQRETMLRLRTSTAQERIDYAWRLAGGRLPTPAEKALAMKFMAEHPDDPAKVKEFALAVFNLNAFLYVN